MSSNYVPCLQGIVLSASGTSNATQYLDLVMEDWKFCRFVVEVYYAATASTTGVVINLYGGTGVLTATPSGGFPQVFYGATVPVQANAHFGDNSAGPVTMTTVTPSLGTPQKRSTSFYFDFPQIRLPGLVRLSFANTDVTNPATISLFADVS